MATLGRNGGAPRGCWDTTDTAGFWCSGNAAGSPGYNLANYGQATENVPSKSTPVEPWSTLGHRKLNDRQLLVWTKFWGWLSHRDR